MELDHKIKLAKVLGWKRVGNEIQNKDGVAWGRGESRDLAWQDFFDVEDPYDCDPAFDPGDLRDLRQVELALSDEVRARYVKLVRKEIGKSNAGYVIFGATTMSHDVKSRLLVEALND